MIVSVVIAGEAGFWVVLALALASRYLIGWRRVSTALLLALPLIDLVVLGATVLDLRHGTTASWTHGLAAAYVGFSAAYGHYLVTWADAHFAHRFAGGPTPVKPPKYGAARAAHEWRIFARTLLAAAITAGLVAGMAALVGDAAQTAGLTRWYGTMGLVTGISLVIAASYTVFPKKQP
ncbi:hypothetical protein GCM10010193_20860 [Kitasatospora atroaurantiaca]|uniref:Uncharacterized protein n=1 Tax=Kitasatospora atroaurantiaca TaxID=285545 RepID=A0A561EVA4_9ACTN|nr:hypothetical protein [Kitasatospora atroaurantiaca]TWE19521.1 hypothetical protein FB465_4639 [Kitasatospora atroaurantiaca]